jgi:hypothetical protein
MAETREARWDASSGAPARRDQRGGHFQAYVPDQLSTRPVVLDRDLAAQAAKTEATVRSLVDAPGSMGLESLGRFLLRSEAIASSRIKGLRKAAGTLADCEVIRPQSFCDLHRALLPDHPQQGLRDQQN